MNQIKEKGAVLHGECWNCGADIPAHELTKPCAECGAMPVLSPEQAKAALAEFIEAQGIKFESVFVPWSQSRNKGETFQGRPMRSLNWRVVMRKGASYVEFDYSMGCGHAPAAKASVKELGGDASFMRYNALAHECETGRRYVPALRGSGAAIPPPDGADMLASLAMDSDVLEYESFESWASEFGYDPDSRNAESVYKLCLAISLKLRAAFGDAELQRLRDIARQL